LVDVASSKTYDDTSWHHFAVVNDDVNQVKIFVDGLNVTPGSPTANSNSWFDSVSSEDKSSIGADFRTTENVFMDGQIDDIKIFNYPLSANQIKREYNQGSAIRFGP
jgi:hypothetical protein